VPGPARPRSRRQATLPVAAHVHGDADLLARNLKGPAARTGPPVAAARAGKVQQIRRKSGNLRAARNFRLVCPGRNAPPALPLWPVSHPRKLHEPGGRPHLSVFSFIRESSSVAKLYVGNLPFTASEADVRTLFSQHGTVESVSLPTDRETGRPRGFGFVEMSNDSEADAAIAALNGANHLGRTLNVNEARPKGEGGGGPRGGGGLTAP